jgi:hypothetical protein
VGQWTVLHLQERPGWIHRPPRPVGLLIWNHQPEPVLGQMLPQCRLMSEKAGQAPNVLQIFGRELGIDDGVIIACIGLRIQLEPLNSLPPQLELKPPHILLGIECVRIAFGEERKVGIVELLFCLVTLVVDTGQYRARALVSLRRYKEGLAAAEQSLALNPSNQRAGAAKATALLYLKRFGQAVRQIWRSGRA